jgi:hypothetical protein
MASNLSSWLGSTPGTSQLEAPSEIQGPHDSRSNRTAVSNAPTYHELQSMDLDWERFRGFERPPPRSKNSRQQTSFIWKYGWRLYKPEDGLEYWICRLCHKSPKQPLNTAKFSCACGRATSQAISHLERRHQIGSEGAITITMRQPLLTPTPGSQGRLDTYCPGASERNRAAESFDDEIFKGLITRLFAVEQLPLQKVQSEAFRDLLIYCNPRCEAALPPIPQKTIAAVLLSSITKDIDSSNDSTRLSAPLRLKHAPNASISPPPRLLYVLCARIS